MSRVRLALAGAAATAAGPALAHAGHRLPGEAPGWTWDPWITAPLAVAALLFALGWWRLRARSGLGQTSLDRRAALFLTGWITMAAALASPLHEAGERSFTAHMIEHELLMLAAAPLLVMAEPLAVMLWAFPARRRHAIGRIAAHPAIRLPWRWLTGAVVATVLQAAILWLWHLPSLFDLALAHEGWHAMQHLCFVLSALLFWSAMLGPRGGGAGNLAVRAVAALCLFVTSLVTGALGALMSFSQSPWYEGYAHLGMAPFGLSPAEDQQLAGLIMWVPGGLVHAIAALVLVRALLGPSREAADAR